MAGLRRVLRSATEDAATERLQTAAPGYMLRVAAAELDLDRFEELAGSAGSEPDLDRAAGYLSEALSL